MGGGGWRSDLCRLHTIDCVTGLYRSVKHFSLIMMLIGNYSMVVIVSFALSLKSLIKGSYPYLEKSK